MGRPAPTALAQRIAAQIAATGPLRLDVFMTLALYDPTHGYYATRQPLGRGGDFVTAPDISQVFGELIGLWMAQSWHEIGAPASFKLVELGPGCGTLLADALRATARVQGFVDACDLHLIEANPHLRAEQATRLRDHAPQWHDTLDTVPHGPCLIVANEFLDCLPVRQFIKTHGHWHEVEVGADDTGALNLGLSPPLTAPPDGAPSDVDLHESAPGLATLIQSVATRLNAAPGRALIIDYGSTDGRTGHTVQALHRHTKVSPLDHIGEADLTAHVNFAALTLLAREAGLAVSGPFGQGDFLRALGAEARCDALIRANPARADEVSKAVARLIDPAHMGALFKVVCLSSQGLPPPPGL
jgi:NADH dehydrogenase [ubiquinone] 1 alpha subcomplex assembly factor 7